MITGCYTSGLGEKPAPEAPQAVGFIIRLEMAPEQAYRQAARVLTDRGYVVAASDPVLQSITTDWKSVVGLNTMRVRVIVDEDGGTNLRIRGDVQLAVNVGKAFLGSNMREDPPIEIVDTGMRGSVARKSWEELEAVAASFGGTYERIY